MTFWYSTTVQHKSIHKFRMKGGVMKKYLFCITLFVGLSSNIAYAGFLDKILGYFVKDYAPYELPKSKILDTNYGKITVVVAAVQDMIQNDITEKDIILAYSKLAQQNPKSSGVICEYFKVSNDNTITIFADTTTRKICGINKN